MFIAKKRYLELCRKIEKCETEIQKVRDENVLMAKRILREPDKLSEELEARENIEAYMDEIIHH